ncbi:energy transducer TonB [beta proteobacterium MWH-UniP1]
MAALSRLSLIYASQRPGLSLPSRELRNAIVAVGAIHLLVVLLSIFGLPDRAFKKQPDVTIEFYAPPPTQRANASNTAATAPPVKATKPPEQTPPPTPVKQAEIPPIKPSTPEPDAPTVTAPLATVQPSAASKSTSSATAAASAGSSATAQTQDADYKAAYLKNPKPPYPSIAVRMRAEGRVILIAQVLPDGRAGEVRIEKSSGYSVLDDSALKTVRGWQFTPARKDGVIVSQAVRIPIDFQLKNY